MTIDVVLNGFDLSFLFSTLRNRGGCGSQLLIAQLVQIEPWDAAVPKRWGNSSLVTDTVLCLGNYGTHVLLLYILAGTRNAPSTYDGDSACPITTVTLDN